MVRAFLTIMLTAVPFAVQAQEAAAPAASAATSWASMFPLVIIFFVFYILLIRPQQKRYKEHQTMLDALKKGDEVVTGGGIIGKITAVSDDAMTVEIASGVQVKVLKGTIASHVSKIAPAKATARKKGVEKNDNVVPDKERIANDN